MILLVGAGPMAITHAQVLQAMGIAFEVVGRGKESAENFHKEIGVAPILQGLSEVLADKATDYSSAVVCVGTEGLAQCTATLLDHGIRKVLVEKPAGLSVEEIVDLSAKVESLGADVYVAYNRRFYSSVIKAQELIEKDGGVTSFNFEITEWSDSIAGLKKAEGVKEYWFLGNTTHVTDMAFYLGGKPENYQAYSSGSLPWHSRSSNFAGAGVSEKGALFSYSGNWDAPGRWGVEILTKQHRFIFKPLEKLQIQERNSVAVKEYVIDDSLDQSYKPGVYLQMKAFLEGGSGLCSIQEQAEYCAMYKEMAGY